MLRWVAQIAIDQQRTFCLVERHRGSQIAGNEATATATADRRHQRNEIAVTHGQKLGPQLAECLHISLCLTITMKQRALLQLPGSESSGLIHQRYRAPRRQVKIGRQRCRERVCQYGEISEFPDTSKQKI